MGTVFSCCPAASANIFVGDAAESRSEAWSVLLVLSHQTILHVRLTNSKQAFELFDAPAVGMSTYYDYFSIVIRHWFSHTSMT